MLLDATVAIMLEDGYAGATSRRVAARAGVKPALVHYYFPNMDELYLAVFREGAQANLDRQQEALESARPLRALWEEASEPRGARLLLEFMALANHRKAIRAEIALWAERWRGVQITALGRILREHGTAGEWSTPAVVSVLMACVGRMLVLEDTLGISTGHDELRMLIKHFVEDVELS
jgi:AcrR family transcriptional regulator